MVAKHLTTEQEGLLETVRAAAAARAAARSTLESQARRMVAQGLREADLAVARTVKAAVDGGISRRRVGLEGLLTSDYGTVVRALELVEPFTEAAAAVASETVSRMRVRMATPAELEAHGFTSTAVARIDWLDLSVFAGQEDPAKGFVDLPNRTVLLDELNTDPNVGAIHTLIGKRQKNPLAKELNRLEAQLTAAA